MKGIMTATNSLITKQGSNGAAHPEGHSQNRGQYYGSPGNKGGNGHLNGNGNHPNHAD
jgi:hypothetical protein